jgi:membrane fusion protein (multidrug efflux system)
LVDQQQATVDKKFIHAPFAGKLGIRQVDLGQYLAAGTTIVTLQQIDPIFMDFTLPQQALDSLKIGAPVTITVDAFPGKSFPGEIAAISPKVDATTRNLQVRASLPNPDHQLLPGMFGTVEIQSGEPQRLLTLPQTAIVFNSSGDSVYIVDEKGTASDGKPDLVARQSFVTTTLARGDQIAVTSGVKEGDTVVTAGQIKIHNGSALGVNNTVQPKNDPNPHPTEQ